MKVLPIILLFFSVHLLPATAVICPLGQTSGDGCMTVGEVYFMGEWVNACCYNIYEMPPGYACVEDDCLAKRSSANAGVPELTPKNAYILFEEGYRAWVIESGKVESDLPKAKEFSFQKLENSLPFARKFFLANKKVEMFSYFMSDSTKIVLKRPSSEEALKKEVEVTDHQAILDETEEDFKMEASEYIHVAPNPAKTVCAVNTDKDWLKIFKVEVHTIKGELIMESNHEAQPVNTVELPLSNLPEGSYLVMIYDQYKRKFRRKLIVE